MNRKLFENYPQCLTLVRHGESEFNKVNITIGLETDELKDKFLHVSDSKVCLTEKGRQQAVKVGQGLFDSGFRFDTAYHSGYTRTKQTLELLLKAFPEELYPLIFENLSLRERESGYTLGMTKTEKKEYFPWMDEYFKKTGSYLARPIGGESIADVFSRVEFELRSLFAENKGKKVLLVSHGRVISVVKFMLEDGWSLGKRETYVNGSGPKNCGVSRYEYDSVKHRLLLVEYDKIFE